MALSNLLGKGASVMERELRDRWVAALRSGEYKQGYGALHHPDCKEYCCLGVLCVIAGYAPNADGFFGGAAAEFVYDLPQAGELWRANDRQGHVNDFNAIADLIEQIVPVD